MHNEDDHQAIDTKVQLLIEFMRTQTGIDPVADFFADMSAKVARFAMDLSRKGLQLSEKWKSSDHVSIKIKEHKNDITEINLTLLEDNQVRIKRKGKEFGAQIFHLPEEQSDATNFVLVQLLESLPKGSRPRISGEELYELVKDQVPRTWDEGVIKDWAVRRADNEGLGRMIYAHERHDSVPATFSPARRELGRR